MATTDKDKFTGSGAVHELVGVAHDEEVHIVHPDGSKVPTGEKVVYDFDDNGKFLGWHKEQM